MSKKKLLGPRSLSNRRSRRSLGPMGEVETQLLEPTPSRRLSRPMSGKPDAPVRRLEISVRLDPAGELALAAAGHALRVPRRYHLGLKALVEGGPVKLPFKVYRPIRRSDKMLLAVPILKQFHEAKKEPVRTGTRAANARERNLNVNVTKPLPTLWDRAIVKRRAALSPREERVTRDSGNTLLQDKHPTLIVAEGFMQDMDASLVVDAVRRASANGQGARIACLANVLHAIDSKVGGERALAYYESILPISDEVEFGEFKPVLLQEFAKVAHRLGWADSAASYALGAIRNALDSGERVIAANLMRQSEALKIL